MTRMGVIARMAFVCVGLWAGTLAYHLAAYLFFHHDSLVVLSVDQCWYEFVGALAFAVTIDVKDVQP